MEISGGKATILCEMIIDAHAYQDDYYYFNINNTDYYYTTANANGAPSETYANNYKYSEIRAWLNDNFYNTAFNSMQKQLVNTVTIDNSARSTNPDGNATQWNSGVNQYACENTEDKVWLLSVQEATKKWQYCSFGSYSTFDTLRQKKTTDYAKANYAYTYTSSNYYGCGVWWLRSPIYNYPGYAWGVNVNGRYDGQNLVYSHSRGVSPALQITL